MITKQTALDRVWQYYILDKHPPSKNSCLHFCCQYFGCQLAEEELFEEPDSDFWMDLQYTHDAAAFEIEDTLDTTNEYTSIDLEQFAKAFDAGIIQLALEYQLHYPNSPVRKMKRLLRTDSIS